MIGLYGGTFNPIHLGHMRAAEEVREALGLDRVLFIPSARPPHKRAESGDAIAPAKLRLEWVELAVKDNPRFEADPIEVDRPGPSYLVDTLRAVQEREGDEELVFIVGQDAFAEMGAWRDPDDLFRLAHICVTTRPPVSRGHLAEWLPECVRQDIEVAPDGSSARHRDAGRWIRQLAITDLDISASDIRRRLREGESVRYLVPEGVFAAIESSRCYLMNAGARAGDPPA
jgi:nicotinate-nucleotide adenylyltransferase